MSGESIPVDLPLVESKPCERADVPSGREAILSALRLVGSVYGEETARWVERIWRKETANFRAGFTSTCSAGMHPWAPRYPWGWRVAAGLWEAKPECRPIGYTLLAEGGTKRKRAYLVFPNPVAFAMTLAHILTARAKKLGSMERAAGSWYSFHPDEALRYARDAKRIATPFCNEVFPS